LILPFDDEAATQFDVLHKCRLGIGTMDMKIAATVLANGGTLLTANLKDFERVPGLTVENWILA
jgi:tRNA(fMet)-specific endonuclease VapC